MTWNTTRRYRSRAARWVLVSGLAGALAVGLGWHVRGRVLAQGELRALAVEPKRVLIDASDFRVTAQEIAAMINAKTLWLRASYLPAGRLDHATQQVARERLMSNEARRRKLDERPEVRAELERVLARALVETELQPVDAAPIREADVQRYYAEHAMTEYTRPERIRVATLVVSSVEKVQRMLPKLKKMNAKKFAKAIKQYSEESGPYLASTDAGWMFREPGNVDPVLVQAAWQLKKTGEVSSVQGTDGRTYVLRLEEYEPVEVYPLDKVRHTIASRIRHERRERAIEALLHRLIVQQGMTVHAVGGSLKMVGAPPTGLPSGSEGAVGVPVVPTVPTVPVVPAAEDD
jgi:hypothetical protein